MAAGTGEGAAFDPEVHLSEVAVREEVERKRNKLRAAVLHTQAQVDDAQTKEDEAEGALAEAISVAESKVVRAGDLTQRRLAELEDAKAALAAFEEEYPDGLV